MVLARKAASSMKSDLQTRESTRDFQIYIINMDRSPDRLDAMAKQLGTLELQYERIPAVDGTALKMDDCEVQSVIDFDHWSRFHHRDALPAEIGCYLSHLRALESFMNSGHKYGVILEDDADISPALADVLEGLKNASDQWDLVKLHSSHPGYQRTCADLGEGNRLTSFITQTGRATGYVISKKAVGRLYQQLIPARLPFDHIFDRNFEHGLKLRGVMPMPLSNRPVISTIEVHRKKPRARSLFPRKWGDPPLSKRWRVPFYRLWTETRRLYYNLVID